MSKLKLWCKKYKFPIYGFVAGFSIMSLVIGLVGVKSVAACFGAFFLGIAWLLGLIAMYSIGWFLFATFALIVSVGKVPSINMPLAATLGIMTTICHCIAYLIWWR
jgi:biotin transporter BioY